MRPAILLLISASLVLIAVALLSGETGSIKAIASFYTPTPQLLLFAKLTGAYLLLCALVCLAALREVRLQKAAALLLLVPSFIALVSLSGSHQYMAALGGFPILGSGQGVIKFAALLVLASSLWRWQHAGATERFWLNYVPVALVLLWIGGMKFLTFEAEGIVPLVESSPLMSWMYQLWSVQTVSNIIGAFDWLALLLLAAGYYWRGAFYLGFAMCLAVFLTTQSFLFTFTPAWQAFTVLSSSGVFLVKDLWFIANMLLITQAFNTRTILASH